MAYPASFRYTKDHEWIKVSGDTGTIGITDYAQHELGDVVFVGIPAVGAKVATGKIFGTIESVKAVSEIYAPVSGEVVETNAALSATPEAVNTDPHGAAWLIKIKLAESRRSLRPDGRRHLPGVHLRRRKGSLGLMRYLPKSPAERREMLAAIGVQSIDELFATIPEQFRLKAQLRLPAADVRAEIIQYFRERAAENSSGYTSFLGAGVYNHLRSVVTDSLIQRGEFLTSYTPYQAEISQGTLQAIFEFQTLMCELTGHGGRQRLDVGRLDGHHRSGADGRAPHGRHRVVVARSLHPEYRQVLDTYTRNLGLEIHEVGFTVDRANRRRASRSDDRKTAAQSSCSRQTFLA